ncbi:MAG TPA: hypothetical protein VK636_19980 [Gemmatimonadaceae bacterium]|nr:hypothetical protein [Gemmatimonadaceae bacterium]
MIGSVLGILLALIGCIWFFQGVGVLPGSFMSGQRRWAINGGIAIVVGIIVIWVSRRGGAPRG